MGSLIRLAHIRGLGGSHRETIWGGFLDSKNKKSWCEVHNRKGECIWKAGMGITAPLLLPLKLWKSHAMASLWVNYMYKILGDQLALVADAGKGTLRGEDPQRLTVVES
jgi:hypothetical protein